MTVEPLEIARQALAAQPFSTLLGVDVTEFASGRAELRVAIRDQPKQQHGFAHGGVICYAADNALTCAGGSALGTAVVTSEFKINYLRPAIGATIIARAAVVRAGQNLAVCRCDVFVVDDDGERLCAVAQGTIARLSEPRNAAA